MKLWRAPDGGIHAVNPVEEDRTLCGIAEEGPEDGSGDDGQLVAVERGRITCWQCATIIRYAKEHRFDKILMGTHGRGGLMQMLLGSVASEVLKHSEIPVTLVKPAAEA